MGDFKSAIGGNSLNLGLTVCHPVIEHFKSLICARLVSAF
jgi:hypothetical protein